MATPTLKQQRHDNYCSVVVYAIKAKQDAKEESWKKTCLTAKMQIGPTFPINVV